MSNREAKAIITVAFTGALVIFGLFAAISVALAIQISTYVNQLSSAHVVEPITVASVAERPAIVEAPEPTQSLQEATTAPAANETQVASEPAPEAPVAVPRAAEMAAAGIAESDHATAALLLLDGDQLKPVTNNGLLHAHRAFNITESFGNVERYVNSVYGGWSGALAQSEATGGMW